LHQNLAVHAQDAADDDAGDEQIEEVSIFGEFNDGFLDLRWQQLVIRERRGDESSKDRGRPDVAQHGRALPDLRAGEATDHEDGDHDGDLALDVAGVSEARQKCDECHVDRDRNDPNAHVDDPPPPLRPPSCMQQFR
jgi:hypothetical protein